MEPWRERRIVVARGPAMDDLPLLERCGVRRIFRWIRAPPDAWRLYNKSAVVEQRIEELAQVLIGRALYAIQSMTNCRICSMFRSRRMARATSDRATERLTPNAFAVSEASLSSSIRNTIASLSRSGSWPRAK